MGQHPLRRLGLSSGMSVVELGCGSGATTEGIATLVPAGSVTAIDVDPLMVRQAREHIAGLSMRHVTILEASVMDTGLRDDQFDFAIARFLFQHISDPLTAAGEVMRILKPGGVLLSSTATTICFTYPIRRALPIKPSWSFSVAARRLGPETRGTAGRRFCRSSSGLVSSPSMSNQYWPIQNIHRYRNS